MVVRPRVRGERAQQADIRAFRRLDWADAPVVRGVYVPHVESRAVSRKTARPEGGQPTLVCQFRQRIRLVHELRELRTPEELSYRRNHRPDVDEGGRRGSGRIDLSRHPFLDDALHAHQPHANVVLDKLADRSHAPVAEVIDVISFSIAAIHEDHRPEKVDDVLTRQRARILVLVTRRTELPVELVTPDSAEVIAPRVEKEVLQEGLCVLDARRLPGAKPPVELQQRLFLASDGGVLFDCRVDIRMVVIDVDILEQLADLIISGVADRPEQHGHRGLALPVDLDRDHVALVGVELHPSPVDRDQLGGREDTAGRRIGRGREVHARRAHKLAHHDALGPVDDERARRRHDRNVADEQLLVLNLPFAGTGTLGVKPHGHVKGRGERGLSLAALLLGLLGFLEMVALKGQLEPAAGEVLDRRNLLEQFLETIRLEPFE